MGSMSFEPNDQLHRFSMNKLYGIELRSKITSDGELHLWLEDVKIPEPVSDEVVIFVEAAPLNPSDIGLLFGPVNPLTMSIGGTTERPTLHARIDRTLIGCLAARLDMPMVVGNEGAGVVVEAGMSAKSLLGRRVAVQSQGMYAQYRVVRQADCMVLPEGVQAREGASAFINPLTALCMVETMRREGHRAMVHTAAASNLGQMLNRVCLADGVPLVNIVRSERQVDVLRDIGAQHIVNSSTPTFISDLTDALAETGATLAFDAVGGGTLAATIIACMEAIACSKRSAYSCYGSTVHKQVYAYGALNAGPKIVEGNLGMAWSIGGWLLPSFLRRIGPNETQRLRDRVAAELTTTFSSHYAVEISLAEVLAIENVVAYGRRSTRKKYLITPNKSAA